MGASYDYAALGCSHHCPGDVQIMSAIPDMEVVLPGTAHEFDALFNQRYNTQRPTYFRLSESENPIPFDSAPGRACVVQEGTLATVLAVGPALTPVMEAVKGLDVTLLYYTTVHPFDRETLKAHAGPFKILLCEPYYRGGLAAEIMETLWPNPVQLATVGVPKRFLTHYGTVAEHHVAIGLTAARIRETVEELIHV